MEDNERLIEWTLDEVVGELQRISLVSEPAIESDFMLFNSQDVKFKTIDEEKRVVTGACMRADIKIPRKDKNGELYYGYFSEDTVRKSAEIFFKKGSNLTNTNLEHEFEVDGVYVFESWIVEDENLDKAKALGFEDVKKGDWWVSMKIENDVVWNNYLKTGLIKGFSVEIRAKEEEVYKKIDDILESDMTVDEKYDMLVDLLK